MCGIIGYIGKKNPIEILIEGLKKLEYRGYDSAGIALKNNSQIEIVKSVGKISELEAKLKNTPLISANIGIAHTRWATHGIPDELNAHPHQVGKITLVHNGIIENAEEIRAELEKEGKVFKSTTDTEVAAALIDKYYQGDIIECLNYVIPKLKGSYAFAIITKDNDKLYALRKDSPLIIGIGEEENFIASDIMAITNYTNKYILLEENEVAVLEQNSYQILRAGQEVMKEVKEIRTTEQENTKNGYKHYMLKEIMEEPQVIEKTLKPYLVSLDNLPNLDSYEEIHIVACGSAMYAGMIGKSLLEEKANIKCLVECASEYRYKKIIYDRKTLVILISQSGETADTIAAMRKAHASNIDTLGIVNVKTSTIAREVKKVLFIEAGPEIAVATTKAYILQVLLLSLLSYKAAKNKNLIKEPLENEFSSLPNLITEILNNQKSYQMIANELYKANNIFFIGRKIDYSICLEGSLKLKEISYIHSEAYQAGELKHGTISLIDKNVPVIAVVTDKEIKEKTLSNIEEVKARGAYTIVLSNENIKIETDKNIIVTKVSDFIQPILIVPILQLIAYEVALLRGCDIDKPKNLAKSVTVE